MIADGDLNRISLDQLKALEKMLPDSGQVCVCVCEYGCMLPVSISWLAVTVTGHSHMLVAFHCSQVETIKAYSGDTALLGLAEDFFRRLLKVKM